MPRKPEVEFLFSQERRCDSKSRAAPEPKPKYVGLVMVTMMEIVVEVSRNPPLPGI